MAIFGSAVFFLLQGIHATLGKLVATELSRFAFVARPMLYLCILPAGAWLLLGRLAPRLLPEPQSGRQAAGEARGPGGVLFFSQGLLWGAGVGGGLALLSLGHWLQHQSGGTPAPGAVVTLEQVVLAVAVTPLLEEWFYRGELQRFFDRGHRSWSLLLQAVLFAAMHPAALFPLLLFVGLACGGLYWRHGLASAIVAHAVYNAALIALHGIFTR